MVVATAVEGYQAAAPEREAELAIGGLALVRRQLQVPVSLEERASRWASSTRADLTPPTELQDDILYGRVVRLPNDDSKIFHIGSVMLLERNGRVLNSWMGDVVFGVADMEHGYSIDPLLATPDLSGTQL